MSDIVCFDQSGDEEDDGGTVQELCRQGWQLVKITIRDDEPGGQKETELCQDMHITALPLLFR